MADELWTFDELLQAVPFAMPDGTPVRPITGFSIDTRSLQPGQVFVALKDQRDGHEFVTQAFRAGASAALVEDTYERKDGDGALIRCDLGDYREMNPQLTRETPSDVLCALQWIGDSARTRLRASSVSIEVCSPSISWLQGQVESLWGKSFGAGGSSWPDGDTRPGS